jgi:hypothetical protein
MTEEIEGDYLQKLAALEAWRAKYAEAADLWDGLELRENDQVAAVAIIAKVQDFETGYMNVCSATSDNTDWVTQLGLMEAWRGMCIEARLEKRDE